MSAQSSEIRLQAEIDIQKDVKYIISRALDRDARLVQLDQLLFFSTETGDAWLLDTVDHLALCLVRGSETQPYVINETAKNFSIEWEASYEIRGNVFVVFRKSGEIRTIIGYPTEEILRRPGKKRP